MNDAFEATCLVADEKRRDAKALELLQGSRRELVAVDRLRAGMHAVARDAAKKISDSFSAEQKAKPARKAPAKKKAPAARKAAPKKAAPKKAA